MNTQIMKFQVIHDIKKNIKVGENRIKRSAVLIRQSRKAFLREWHLSRSLEEMLKQTVLLFEKTPEVKTKEALHGKHGCGVARRSV